MKSSGKKSENEIQKLTQELEIHQGELEMQNEELVQAREETKQALEKYTELYDFAPTGYFTISKECRIIDLNLTGASLLGKERWYLKNNRFDTFVTDETKPQLFQFLKDVFTSRLRETCDLNLTPFGNSPIYVHVVGIVTENSDFCFLSVVDITERKHAENELIIAKEKAEENNRLKSAFLSNISHEIRTPMNGIMGFAGLLKESRLKGDQQMEYIDLIEESGAHLLYIINEIIEISKIDSEQINISLSVDNINDLLESVYNDYMPEAEQKGIHLHFGKLLPPKKAIIKTDFEKVNIILSKLVDNAVKFTSSGSIEFGYYCIESGQAQVIMQFYVKDSGIGIPSDKQEAVFDLFVQSDNSDIRTFQGAGLGLSIAKAYVEMLGGKIWVESKLGKGSTFFFTLPTLLS